MKKIAITLSKARICRWIYRLSARHDPPQCATTVARRARLVDFARRNPETNGKASKKTMRHAACVTGSVRLPRVVKAATRNNHNFLFSRRPAMKTALRSLLSLALALVAGVALAQPNVFRDAGAKIRGDAYWPSRAATRSIEHARGYAREFQGYVAKTEKPEPSVVNDVKVNLGRYLEDAKKHLATMKKDFSADKETVAAIEKIEKELTAAVEANQAMIDCCQLEKFDKIAGMACCTDLVKQLDKIHASHQALMQKLTGKK
jgi:hypothetical protein